MSEYLPPNRLLWNLPENARAIWPSEPDISVIRSIAISVLQPMYPYSNMGAVSVAFFGAGVSNKMYQVEHPTWPVKYLFRVSLPVDPFNKTESEIATLVYVRRHTTIPVPNPVAWNSSSNNALGYEWSLLEKIEGVELSSVWGKMPWEAKVKLAHDLAGICAQLWKQRLDKIGSLVFGDRYQIVAGQRLVQDALPDTITVGKMVTPCFFAGRRIHVPADRGPYDSSHDWVQAVINFQQNLVISGEKIIKRYPHVSEEELDLGRGKYDFADRRQLCVEYLRALPYYIPPNAESVAHPCFVLSHEDLHASNILIDPEKLNITGIIDWEMARILPEWAARKAPKIFDRLNTITPLSPPSPVGAGTDALCAAFATQALRERWELYLLRRGFDARLRQLGTSLSEEPSDGLKNSFLSDVHCLSVDWSWAQESLENFMQFRPMQLR